MFYRFRDTRPSPIWQSVFISNQEILQKEGQRKVRSLSLFHSSQGHNVLQTMMGISEVKPRSGVLNYFCFRAKKGQRQLKNRCIRAKWTPFPYVLLCFWSWQRAKQEWSAGRIWPTGRHLRRPDLGYHLIGDSKTIQYICHLPNAWPFLSDVWILNLCLNLFLTIEKHFCEVESILRRWIFEQKSSIWIGREVEISKNLVKSKLLQKS